VSAGRRDPSARLAWAWPRTSPRSRWQSVFRWPGPASGCCGAMSRSPPFKYSTGVVNGLEGMTVSSPPRRPRRRLAAGTECARDTGAPAMKSHGQHTPGRADMAVSESSPRDDRLVEATRFHHLPCREYPERMGRSKTGLPCGARRGEIDRDAVHGKTRTPRCVWRAHPGRGSRRTAESGSPTVVKEASPGRGSTSTGTSAASTRRRPPSAPGRAWPECREAERRQRLK